MSGFFAVLKVVYEVEHATVIAMVALAGSLVSRKSPWPRAHYADTPDQGAIGSRVKR